MKDYSNYYPSFKELVVDNGKMIFEQQLQGFEGKDILINNKIETKALVKYHQNPLNEFKQNRKITFWHEDDVKRGDIIKTLEDNRTFIIMSQVNQNDLVKYALMRETNHNLKWIDSSNNLITKPSIVSAQTLYTTGVKDEKVIEIPNGMIGVQLPYDEDTKKLDREASFVFNKAKYKITFYNEVEYEGLLVLICSEIGTSHLDDEINQIADRWKEVNGKKIDRLPWLDNQEPPEQPTEPQDPDEPIEEPEPTEPKNITYKPKVIPQYQNEDGTEIYYGEWCKYTVHKFIDNVEVDGNFTFEIETLNNPQNIELATLEIENNICKVIANNNAIMGGSIKLVVTDTETGQVAIEKEIEIMGM